LTDPFEFFTASVLSSASAYAGVSLIIALLIALFGVQRLDPSASGWRNLGFRALIVPGLCIFWPLLLPRLWRKGSPPVERTAHRLLNRS